MAKLRLKLELKFIDPRAGKTKYPAQKALSLRSQFNEYDCNLYNRICLFNNDRANAAPDELDLLRTVNRKPQVALLLDHSCSMRNGSQITPCVYYAVNHNGGAGKPDPEQKRDDESRLDRVFKRL